MKGWQRGVGSLAFAALAALPLAMAGPAAAARGVTVAAELAQAGGYLLPNSQYTYLTQQDLMTAGPPPYTPAWYRWLRLARNEIYARHGYIFESRELRVYFRSQPWYVPRTRHVSLNRMEQANVALIQSFER